MSPGRVQGRSKAQLGSALTELEQSPDTSLMRTAFFTASCAFPEHFWIIWDGKKQAWHDKVFGTYVLKRQP
jgi:hypothetical protein